MSEDRLKRIFMRLRSETQGHWPGFQCGLLVGHPKDFPKKRNQAMCMFQGTKGAAPAIDIIVAPKMVNASTARQEGVLRHEFGHAVEFYLGLPLLNETAYYNGITLHHGAERRADNVAEWIYSQPISYDTDTVQTIGPGTSPRPAHLGH